jgi:lambda repressor-like predicted transcriptional regulator
MTKLDNHSKKLLRDPDARWAWIKYQLQLQGRSLAQVAHEAGVTRQCIYHAGQMTYPRMEKIIARALGMEPKDLFPERYDQATGLPFYRKGRPLGAKTKRRIKRSPKHSRTTPDRNVGRDCGNEYEDAA